MIEKFSKKKGTPGLAVAKFLDTYGLTSVERLEAFYAIGNYIERDGYITVRALGGAAGTNEQSKALFYINLFSGKIMKRQSISKPLLKEVKKQREANTMGSTPRRFALTARGKYAWKMLCALDAVIFDGIK